MEGYTDDGHARCICLWRTTRLRKRGLRSHKIPPYLFAVNCGGYSKVTVDSADKDKIALITNLVK